MMIPETHSEQDSFILDVRAVEKTVLLGQQTLQILKPIDLHIKAGESVAIVGVSGSGKSTLLGLLAGLDQPSRGQIILAGHTLTDLNEDERAEVRARYVGFVFQSFQLMPNLSALENVMLPLELLNKAHAQTAAKTLLDHVGLSHRLKHYPRQLSGGEQQRVALARAFVTRPAVLFADEPTGNLDRHTGQRIADLLFQLNTELNTTLVLVTHDQSLAQRCQRELTMEDGTITAERSDLLIPSMAYKGRHA